MTIDKQKLKALAEAATGDVWIVNGKQSVRGAGGEYIAKTNWRNGISNAEFIAAVSPTTILALIAEIERLEATKGDPAGSFDKHMEYMRENNHLKAENEALRKTLGDLLALYEDDEGCRELPEYIAGRAVMAKEASHG